MARSKPPLRTAKEVAYRVLCLAAVAGYASGEMDEAELKQWLTEQGLTKHLSPREQAFLDDATVTRKLRMNMGWRIEGAMTLMWALGAPIQQGSKFAEQRPSVVLDLIPGPGDNISGFLRSAQLRSQEEIDNDYEIVYEAHWRVRDASLNGRPVPSELNIDVIQERHKALNWLKRYCNLPWDEVTTDT